MTDIDKKIFEALNKEDQDVLMHEGRDMGVVENVVEAFAGKRGKFNFIAIVFGVASAIAIVYCIIQFFGTSDTNMRLLWLGGFLGMLIANASIKIYFWMEMNRACVTRDIKRLELQMSLILQRLDQEK